MLTKQNNAPFYRIQQVYWYFNAVPLSHIQIIAIHSHLNRAQIDLFNRYSPTDKQHAYRVLQTLQEAGYNDPDLFTAALLHDVGKTKVAMTLIDRIIVVLGHRLTPKQAKKWGKTPLNQAVPWHHPFIVRQQHPKWSAQMAEQANTTPLALQLIQHHQDRPHQLSNQDPLFQKLLRALQWADDLN